jgi:hypothetical protein
VARERAMNSYATQTFAAPTAGCSRSRISAMRRQSDGDEMRAFQCEFLAETERAWLLSIGDEEIWLPKSQCEFEGEDQVLVPLWLARKRSLA